MLVALQGFEQHGAVHPVRRARCHPNRSAEPHCEPLRLPRQPNEANLKIGFRVEQLKAGNQAS